MPKKKLNYVNEEVIVAMFPPKELDKLLYYWNNRYCPVCKDDRIQVAISGNEIGVGTDIICINCDWREDITDYSWW